MRNTNLGKQLAAISLIGILTILSIPVAIFIYSILELLLKTFMSYSLIVTNNTSLCFILALILGILFCMIIFKLSLLLRNKYNLNNSKRSLMDLKNNWPKFILSSIIIYLIMSIGNFIIQMAFMGTHPINTTSNQASLNSIFNTSPFDKTYIIILALLLAPIIEELIFRWGILTVSKNYIFKAINLHNTNKKLYHAITFILLLFSAVTFAFLHSPLSLSEFTLYFWMGLCIGAIYLKYNNIYASMICHFIVNAFALVSMVLL